jgi:predicted NAD/FAD-binding protein
VKIAVIGSGVSGLVAAHLLGRKHEVTVFEADSRLGGHINTVEIPGKNLAIDTGFIVFSEPNYPLFTKLLNKLEVASKPTTMSFSVRDDRSGTEYSGNSLDSLFAQRGNALRPEHWRMLFEIRRFMKIGPSLIHERPEITVREFLKSGRYPTVFAERFLIPLASALWSCPAEQVLQSPIRFVAEFLHNHRMLQISGKPVWRVVEGGSRTYMKALLKQTKADFQTNRAAESLVRNAQGIDIQTGGKAFRFDEVVVAAHADHALRMLEDPSPEECELLASFPYQPNEVVLHTDTSVLPKQKKAWASWNYRIPANPEAKATVTYNMNLLQGLDAVETYSVSLNQSELINPANVVARFTYDHPVATAKGMYARQRREELIRHKGVSYCGAYWGYGFHEDGVRSAVEVAAAFGEGEI